MQLLLGMSLLLFTLQIFDCVQKRSAFHRELRHFHGVRPQLLRQGRLAARQLLAVRASRRPRHGFAQLVAQVCTSAGRKHDAQTQIALDGGARKVCSAHIQCFFFNQRSFPIQEMSIFALQCTILTAPIRRVTNLLAYIYVVSAVKGYNIIGCLQKNFFI